MKTKEELESRRNGLLLCFIFGWAVFCFASIVLLFNFVIELIPILIFLATTVLILVMLLMDTKNRLRILEQKSDGT